MISTPPVTSKAVPNWYPKVAFWFVTKEPLISIKSALSVPNIWEEPLITPSASNFDLIVVLIDDVNDSKLAVSTSNADNLVNAEPLNVFRLLTEMFTLPEVDSKLFNLPTLAV